jgi:hypothetical protein
VFQRVCETRGPYKPLIRTPSPISSVAARILEFPPADPSIRCARSGTLISTLAIHKEVTTDMNAHCLQHVSFEGLGSIQSFLQAAGYRITKTQFYESATLPKPDEIDLLIVMGGPMSVNDEDEFPWLAGSEGCENQAFQFCRSVIGLQFHLETTLDSAQELVENCRNELLPAEYVQTEAEILSAEPEKYGSINDLMDKVLSYLSDGEVRTLLKL